MTGRELVLILDLPSYFSDYIQHQTICFLFKLNFATVQRVTKRLRKEKKKKKPFCFPRKGCQLDIR